MSTFKPCVRLLFLFIACVSSLSARSQENFVETQLRGDLYGSTPPGGLEYEPKINARSARLGGLACIAGSGRWGPDFGCFDPFTFKYTWRRLMDTTSADFGFAQLDEYLHLVGGTEWGKKVSAVHLSFSAETGGWSVRTALPSPRTGLGLAGYRGKLYAVGGADSLGRKVSTVEIYSATTGDWISGPAMPTKRSGVFVVPIRVGLDKYSGIYALLGTDSNNAASAAVEYFNVDSGTWIARAPIPMPRTGSAVATMTGKIFVFGGTPFEMSRCEPTVQIYDALTNKWGFGPMMPEPRCEATATTVNGNIFIFGGYGSDHAFSKRARQSILVFSPVHNRWFTLNPPSPPPPRPYQPIATFKSDVDNPTKRMPERKNDFALVIGIENYKSVQAARYAEKDAAAAAANFRALGVPEKNIVTLTGPGATLSGIGKYVESWLHKNVEEDSRVYFYFSGHGAPDPEGGAAFLVPWDADLPFLRQTAYPLKKLYAELASLRAKEVVVLLDACFSGSGQRSVLLAGTRPLVTVTETPAPSLLTVMTASAAKETAGSFDEQQHGLFTYFLLKGLFKDDRPMTFEGLHSYVRDGVLREAHRQNREQNSQLTSPAPAALVY